MVNLSPETIGVSESKGEQTFQYYLERIEDPLKALKNARAMQCGLIHETCSKVKTETAGSYRAIGQCEPEVQNSNMGCAHNNELRRKATEAFQTLFDSAVSFPNLWTQEEQEHLTKLFEEMGCDPRVLTLRETSYEGLYGRIFELDNAMADLSRREKYRIEYKVEYPPEYRDHMPKPRSLEKVEEDIKKVKREHASINLRLMEIKNILIGYLERLKIFCEIELRKQGA